MTLPDPSFWGGSRVDSKAILYYYPHVIDYMQNSVCLLPYEPYLWFGWHQIKTFENRNALYDRHLGLYEQYVTGVLQLYEQRSPGFCAIFALIYKGRNLHRLYTEIWWRQPFVLGPIIHPKRHSDDPTMIFLEPSVLNSGVHPLLASILTPRAPKMHLETALSCLRYLQSGGHSFKTRKSRKPLLQSSHFMKLKMRPSLSHFRNRRHRHSSRRCFLHSEDLCSIWWRNHPNRPEEYIHGRFCMFVSLSFFSYRKEYRSTYGSASVPYHMGKLILTMVHCLWAAEVRGGPMSLAHINVTWRIMG